MDPQDIQKLFLTLVALPGQSGQEKTIAEFIIAHYEKIGWKVWQDDSGKKNDSTSGNVYALLEVDPKKPTLVFSAHMDTVIEPGQSVSAVIDGDRISSDNTTILGADDRAGVATVLTASAHLDKNQLKHNILCFFTTREESGIMGSSFFQQYGKVRYIFNVDSTDKPGVFITHSLGYQNFAITVHGKAAHAAKAYELGIDAIRASAYLIQKLPKSGSRTAGWTCNIGSIQGGSGTNVVPEKVHFKGEMRAYNQTTLDAVKKRIRRALQATEAKFGVTTHLQMDESSYIAPFQKSDDPSIFRTCRTAAKAVKLKAVFKKSYSTSDANQLSRHGFPTVSVSRGGMKSHAKDESILLSELVQASELVRTLMLTSQ